MKFKFSYLLLLISLSVAATAAYFSVWGLSQLFAGASTAIIIMASILEVGKIITTTTLHRYWGKLAKTLRIYLTISVFVLMVITSAGIYGFLSNAYQKTADKLEIHEGELTVLDSKKTYFEKGIADNEKIVATKNKRIDQLSALRSNQETRLDSAKYTRAKDKARVDIETATKEIQKLTEDIDVLNLKNNVLSDSIGKYNLKALELKANNTVAGEVGPLKYIAQLTGMPMGVVVNYLILLLIFVFDPLAVALILATNRVFELERNGNDKSDDNDGDKKKVPTPVPPTVLEPMIESEEIPTNLEVDVKSEEIVEEELQPKQEREPVIPNGKIELKDIKEMKDDTNRGYSVPVPQPKSNNSIQRVGSNKIVKNGDNDKLFFKRKT